MVETPNMHTDLIRLEASYKNIWILWEFRTSVESKENVAWNFFNCFKMLRVTLCWLLATLSRLKLYIDILVNKQYDMNNLWHTNRIFASVFVCITSFIYGNLRSFHYSLALTSDPRPTWFDFHFKISHSLFIFGGGNFFGIFPIKKNEAEKMDLHLVACVCVACPFIRPCVHKYVQK